MELGAVKELPRTDIVREWCKNWDGSALSNTPSLWGTVSSG